MLRHIIKLEASRQAVGVMIRRWVRGKCRHPEAGENGTCRLGQAKKMKKKKKKEETGKPRGDVAGDGCRRLRL